MKRLDYEPNDSAMVYIWALILPLMLSVIISMCAYGSPVDTDGTHLIFKETWFICMLRILSAGLLIGLFFVYNKTQKISGLTACGIKTKTHYLNIAFCVILGIGLVYFSSPIITIITYLISLTGINISTGIDLPLENGWDFMLSLLLIGVLPAVTEELIYRGMIFNGLKKWGKWPAILISALAFCLMHGSVEQFTYTFLLGIVLGYLMWETGALWLCMIVHFTNNATVLTSMFISAQTGDTSSTLPTTIGGLDVAYALGMFLIAIGLVILIFYLMKKIKNKTKTTATIQTDSQNKLAIANSKQKDMIMLIVGFVIAIVFTIIQTL